MLRWDRIASLVLLVCGAILAVGAQRMELGSLNQPGPGFLPLGAAGLLVALALAYAVSSFRRAPDGADSPWPQQNRTTLIVVVASLALYCAALSSLGFIPSTFVLMVVLFLAADPGKWLAALIKAALSVAISYLVFEKLLMIQFPAGLFGG
jgi:putative tricarboxylic transport membrane protein